MNMNPYIEEIEKRFDEKFGNWKVEDLHYARQEVRKFVQEFYRAELPSLLSKFTAEINGKKINPRWKFDQPDVKHNADGYNSHHRSVAEKAEEIIKSINP